MLNNKYFKTLIALVIISIEIKAQEVENMPVIPSGNSKEKVYVTVDKQPEFPGGKEGLLKFYQKYSEYPVSDDRKQGLTVYFQVVIDTVGKVINYKVLRNEGGEKLDEMTKNLVLKMPNWSVGILNDKPVFVLKNLSITYMKSKLE